MRIAAQESGGLGSGPRAAVKALIHRDDGLDWDDGQGPAQALASYSRGSLDKTAWSSHSQNYHFCQEWKTIGLFVCLCLSVVLLISIHNTKARAAEAISTSSD